MNPLDSQSVSALGRCSPWLPALFMGALLMVGCKDDRVPPTPSKTPPALVQLKGSGASFPAALYEVWIKKFNAREKGISVSYESKGSGGGIDEFIAGRVDFAGSDAALNDEHLIAQGNTALMLPVTAGAIVVGYNLKEVSDPLRLSREVYAGIFKGRITFWNDHRIQELNPNANLPSKEITIVHRSDPSGTTWVFLNHLDKLDYFQDTDLGVDLMGNWPPSEQGDGNAGVAKKVSEIDGSIGYVQQIAARKRNVAEAILENREGNFVSPTTRNVSAALARIGLPQNLRAWMPDPVGEQSYPITTYTWILVDREAKDAAAASALRMFLKFALGEGQQESEALGYVPLPPAIAAEVSKVVDQIHARTPETARK